jgi:hypothetical protein
VRCSVGIEGVRPLLVRGASLDRCDLSITGLEDLFHHALSVLQGIRLEVLFAFCWRFSIPHRMAGLRR